MALTQSVLRVFERLGATSDSVPCTDNWVRFEKKSSFLVLIPQKSRDKGTIKTLDQ